MPPPPPQPPAISSKRILPAFLLCFTIGAHRLYAGKYISGIIQMAWVAGAFLWSYHSLKGLLEIVHSTSTMDENTIERISDWQQANSSTTFLPSAALIAVGIWIAIDAGLLLRGRFTDGEGLRITRWL